MKEKKIEEKRVRLYSFKILIVYFNLKASISQRKSNKIYNYIWQINFCHFQNTFTSYSDFNGNMQRNPVTLYSDIHLYRYDEYELTCHCLYYHLCMTGFMAHLKTYKWTQKAKCSHPTKKVAIDVILSQRE